MFQKVDWYNLIKLEKFAQCFQKMFGKNCFWLARVAAVCYGVSIVAVLLPGVFMGKTPLVIVNSILMMFCFLVVFWFFKLIKRKQRVVYNFQEANLSNPYKIEDYASRTTILSVLSLCFFIVVINLITGYFIFLIGSMMLGALVFWQGLIYYFSACDPLPPAKSKVRQWLEKVVFVAKEALSPTPQPQPIPVESRFL